ncbi:N-acetylglutaminylglutamine amidotransferase [Luteococcus sanguinis]|uniref:asparagine synthase (glutamine-hydrolyzing) n=1 Tax=Luteococcus sanguinis TaxID=174038 RepID=A0ABW1X1I8_9ACTN
MCGICGEVRFDGRTADVAAIAAMNAQMIRRGPDAGGIWSHDAVALGHRRLSIIDLSVRGSQPMTDTELARAVVFNGCIYNYRELRAELEGQGYRFFSGSDTEVVLKAHHCWGADCVEHFVGMFAFAVVDLDTGVVTLGRDRLGIKPLYYSQTASRLRFASSLRALVAAGDVDRSIDLVALHHYLSFHSVVPAPRTMLQGIRKLPPATVRVVQPDGRSTDQLYWEPCLTRQEQYAGWDARDWGEALMTSLSTAVQRRMVADVPVGVLLSGGFDSSLVVALLAELGQHELATFSIGFDSAGGESGDEYEYSDIVAKRFDTNHHKIHIGTEKLLPAVLPTVEAMAEPMVSHDCVAFYLLSQEVAQHVKVVQSGQGADEILAGYDWYPPLSAVPRDQVSPAYRDVFVDRPHEAVNRLLQPHRRLDHDPTFAFLSEHQGRRGAETALDAALRLDTQVMLVDDPVKRVDNMTMAWGLEARVPFLDHEFVELAAACPPELKLAGGGKGVLKEAGRRIVPHEVIDRTKGYFPVPGIRHLEGEVLDLVHDALGSQTARDRGLFEPGPIESLLADPNTTRTTLGSNELWQVALLEMWLQTL